MALTVGTGEMQWCLATNVSDIIQRFGRNLPIDRIWQKDGVQSRVAKRGADV